MKLRWVTGFALLCAAAGVAAGESKPSKAAKTATPTEAPAPPAEAEAEPTGIAAIPHTLGPKHVELGFHAAIDLPANMALFEGVHAREVMTKFGNDPEHTVAVIFPTAESSGWFVAIDAADAGYVTDDDADDLDADKLLGMIREGTGEQNKKRIAQGIPEMIIDSWAEKPHYNKVSHQLVWSINAHDKVAPTPGSAAAPADQTINYMVRTLGRNGFLAVDVVTSKATFAKDKQEAQALLDATHFLTGYRYQDHVSGDRSSGVGLTGLIVGGGAVLLAKKGGILVAILLGLKKGIVVVFVAIGAFFKRMFSRKKREDVIVGAGNPPPDGAGGPPPGGFNPPPPADGGYGPPPGGGSPGGYGAQAQYSPPPSPSGWGQQPPQPPQPPAAGGWGPPPPGHNGWGGDNNGGNNA